jgi:hypothetical protein
MIKNSSLFSHFRLRLRNSKLLYLLTLMPLMAGLIFVGIALADSEVGQEITPIESSGGY